MERKRTTKTLDERLDLRRDAPSDPVTALYCQPDGEFYDLAELLPRGRRLAVGASQYANLTIPDDYVSARHCLLHVEKQRLFVKCVGAKNRTLVNGIPLKPRSGFVELLPGAVLTLGKTQLLVCGRAGQQQQAYVAPPMWALLLRAMRLFGTGVRVAARLGVPTSTISDWSQRRFAPPRS